MASTQKSECSGYIMLREKFPEEDESLHRDSCSVELFDGLETSFCVMHAPTKDKEEKFGEELHRKLEAKNHNFRGAWFPGDVDFTGHDFDTETNFSFAVFSGTTVFNSATFHLPAALSLKGRKFVKTISKCFDNTIFNGNITFNKTHFIGNIDFTGTKFFGERVSFDDAEFNQTETGFKEEGKVSFDSAEFGGMETGFRNTKFNQVSVSFSKSKFGAARTIFESVDFACKGPVNFSGAQFGGKAYFGSFNLFPDIETDEFIGKDTEFKVPANFHSAVFEDDVSFNHTKFEDACFDMAVFHGNAIFSNTSFEGEADFTEARFNNENAYFDSAEFKGSNTKFRKARFKGSVSFESTGFTNHVSFNDTVFGSHAFFDDAKFNFDAKFCTTPFVDFRLARFMDLTRFLSWKITPGAQVYFGEAIFDKPERVYFGFIDNLELSWFLNTDTRKFNYQEVRFPALKEDGPIIHEELRKAQELFVCLEKHDRSTATSENKEKEIELPYAALATVFRRMAENAEENSHFRYASDDRKFAFEVERLERREWRSKKQSLFLKIRDDFFEIPYFLYRWLSEYGENWSRALLVLGIIWVVFALLYVSPLFQIATENTGKEPSLWNFTAFGYSFLVMALQKPEPAPVNVIGKMLVGFETVFSPLQFALLALALRRKFMR